MRRWVVVGLAFLAVACGSGTATTPVAAAPKLPGLGATDADWEAAHQKDPDKQPGSAYLPKINGGGDRYAAVQHSRGHVTGFTLQYSPGVVQATVVAEAVS